MIKYLPEGFLLSHNAGSEMHGVEDVVLLVAVADLDAAYRSVSIQDDRDGDLD